MRPNEANADVWVTHGEPTKTKQFANGSCKLSVQTPDLGEAQEELNVSYEGDPLEIGFNAAYLLEILKFIPTDEVRMTFKAPERAATCEPVGWDDPASYLALVMPLRLVD